MAWSLVLVCVKLCAYAGGLRLFGESWRPPSIYDAGSAPLARETASFSDLSHSTPYVFMWVTTYPPLEIAFGRGRVSRSFAAFSFLYAQVSGRGARVVHQDREGVSGWRQREGVGCFDVSTFFR